MMLIRISKPGGVRYSLPYREGLYAELTALGWYVETFNGPWINGWMPN